MLLTEEELQTFIDLNKTEFGVELSRQEAIDEFIKVSELVRIVYLG